MILESVNEININKVFGFAFLLSIFFFVQYIREVWNFVPYGLYEYLPSMKLFSLFYFIGDKLGTFPPNIVVVNVDGAPRSFCTM